MVDDTPDFLAIVAMLLENQNYKAFLRSAGRNVVSVVKRQRPDLVILDLMLPDIDGLEVLARLKDDPETSKTPVIICSADKQRIRTHKQELNQQAVAVLEKPIELDDLLFAVQKALGEEPAPR